MTIDGLRRPGALRTPPGPVAPVGSAAGPDRSLTSLTGAPSRVPGQQVTPLLVTPRLRLRPIRPADADQVVALHGDPAVMRLLGTGRPVPPARVLRRDLPRLLAHYGPSPLGCWAAEDRATDSFVGWFELRPMVGGPTDSVELGYRLHRAAWGRGLATEGARALVDAVFRTSDALEVVATTMAVNTASRRVMEKVGLHWRRTYTEAEDGGARNDGARNDGARNDGARNDGARFDGAPGDVRDSSAARLGDVPGAIPGTEHGEVEYALSRTDWRPLRAEPFHRRQPRRWAGRRS